MANGGILVKDQTRRAIRLSGLILPLLLLQYGLLARNAIFDDSHYMSDAAFLLIMVPWIGLALLQIFAPATNKQGVALRLGAYHIFAALYILFVSGFSMPLVATWSLLILSSYLYFSRPGIYLSLAALALTAVLDMLLRVGNSYSLTETLLSLYSVIIIGTLVVYLNHIEQIDNTELKKSKAKESLQRDRINTLINNLADAVISTDEKGVIQVYNAAALNLLNTNTNLNGRHVNKVVRVTDQEDGDISLFEDFKDKRGMNVRDDLKMDIDGEITRLEVTSSPIRSSYGKMKRNSSPDGYMLILRDVTKSKSLEEERDEFISVVSHELRTPITIAEGTISNVQLMIERGNLPPETLKNGLTSAHEQVLFLAKMVNDLSTLSRAERGVADTPEVISVRQLVDSLYKEYAPQAQKKHLRFNLDISGQLGTVTASRLYLHELLQNFITNAIKYTKEGDITLKIARDGGTIKFAVSDTGIGISKSDQAKIFNKFYRSEDYRTRETGGTGLGLYVAAKLAKKLRTEIEVKSRLNHGSTFGFTMPADDSTR